MILLDSLLIGAGVLMVAHAADYYYQADMHGWQTPFSRKRAQKLPWYADWIPRDPWHGIQMVRNLAWMAGTVLVWNALLWPWYWHVAGLLITNALTRGVGFSSIYKLSNGLKP